jgi:hypothetical protein
MRFVPGCSAALASVIGGLALLAPDQVDLPCIIRVVTELLGLTAGFAGALTLSGPRLVRLRRLGRRSLAAGFIAPLLAGVASMVYPDASLPVIALLCALAGAAALVPVAPGLLRFRVRAFELATGPQAEF